MNWQYLTGKDMQDFFERYPGAYAFLLHRSLKGELDSLKMEMQGQDVLPQRAGWLKDRIQELEKLFQEVSK